MPTPTQVTLEYVATLTGTESVTQLATAMANVILPVADFQPLGVFSASDTTTVVGTTVHRVLVFDLLPHFIPGPWAPVSSTGYGQGSIVSSSPNDTINGTGVQRVRLIAKQTEPNAYPPPPTADVPVEADVDMNGTTPVNLPWRLNQNFPLLTLTPIITQAGSLGTNDGQINVYATLDARATPQAQIVTTLNHNWQGSIISTSPEDKAGGLGVQAYLVSYLDSASVAHTETIIPNGQTPVNFVNTNHAIITNMVPTAIGAGGGNLGIVTVFNGLEATGGPTGQLPASFFSYFPIGSDETVPFVELFTHILADNLVTRITALAPVLT